MKQLKDQQLYWLLRIPYSIIQYFSFS